ncbi:hypothetical protein, partial [Sinomonas sp.]|uniref:hypothetical protein n=1 Tax=Sinomonas sp. TaxID=1914986 RepID=UPI003F813DA7
LERAERAQHERMEAIRNLAKARQGITDARDLADHRRAELEREIAAFLADAERDDLKAYTAAVTAGWTEPELRRIGFDEPAKKARVRRRAARPAGPQGSPSEDTGATGPVADGQAGAR